MLLKPELIKSFQCLSPHCFCVRGDAVVVSSCVWVVLSRWRIAVAERTSVWIAFQCSSLTPVFAQWFDFNGCICVFREPHIYFLQSDNPARQSHLWSSITAHVMTELMDVCVLEMSSNFYFIIVLKLRLFFFFLDGACAGASLNQEWNWIIVFSAIRFNVCLLLWKKNWKIPEGTFVWVTVGICGHTVSLRFSLTYVWVPFIEYMNKDDFYWSFLLLFLAVCSLNNS